jgi:hypothetical protein
MCSSAHYTTVPALHQRSWAPQPTPPFLNLFLLCYRSCTSLPTTLASLPNHSSCVPLPQLHTSLPLDGFYEPLPLCPLHHRSCDTLPTQHVPPLPPLHTICARPLHHCACAPLPKTVPALLCPAHLPTTPPFLFSSAHYTTLPVLLCSSAQPPTSDADQSTDPTTRPATDESIDGEYSGHNQGIAKGQNGRGEGKRRTWDCRDEQQDWQGAQTNATWYMQKKAVRTLRGATNASAATHKHANERHIHERRHSLVRRSEECALGSKANTHA